MRPWLPAQIWVSPDEIRRIAKYLNMSVQRFLDTHTKQYSKYKGWRMLKTGEANASCIFLGADNKCSIHPVRPSQCSTYPWWPELMVDREWEWEKANVCEGFDHAEAGPLDVEEAAKQLREANKMTQLRLLASTVRITPQVSEWADNVLVWDSDLAADGEQGRELAQQEADGEGRAKKGINKPKRKGGKGTAKGG
ncbi:hypothetical protein GPECTOR_67g324 [Gonium pectorale]|uniref:YkgJ family cysteine cluster protein n=1 Tax=Gonium pectorale TaxID=33097 RepID=A0A150G3T0_GONPE|nr:hypothetical protein GPECTOR_67g324 [Gonium pectorale]|eukprot:KXZ44484.1 hypothetical protein GPECTOR_67g324 [Gonium pectorale]